MGFCSEYRLRINDAMIASYRATFFPLFWFLGLEAYAEDFRAAEWNCSGPGDCPDCKAYGPCPTCR